MPRNVNRKSPAAWQKGPRIAGLMMLDRLVMVMVGVTQPTSTKTSVVIVPARLVFCEWICDWVLFEKRERTTDIFQ